jgi:hypothetical protein
MSAFAVDVALLGLVFGFSSDIPGQPIDQRAA